MGVNYKAIANADPGGELEAAYAEVSAETISVGVDIRLDDIKMAAEFGYDSHKLFKAALETMVGTGVVDQDVMDWYVGKGIELNTPDSIGVIEWMVASNHITRTFADNIIALSITSTPKYPDLEEGDLQVARKQRVAGEI